MPSTRPTSWLPVAGLLVSAAAVLGWLLLGFAGARAGKVKLPDAASGATVEILVGQKIDLPLADVVRLPASTWKVWRGGGNIAGRHGVELWLRLTLRNGGDAPQAGVLDSGDYFADRVEAWWARPDGQWERAISGEAVADGEKALSGRDVAFPLSVPAKGERVVYLRLTDFFAPVAAPVWWPVERDFQAAKSRGLLAEGIYLGGLLALLGYNVMLWLRLRQADLGWYACWLVTIAAFMLLARGQLTVLGGTLGSPGLETGLAVAIAVSAALLTGFAREFLELKTRARRIDRVAFSVQLGLLAVAVGACAMPWLKSTRMLEVAVEALGITHLALFGLAVWSWRAGGVRPARFLVLSFSCVFSATLPAVGIWLWADSHKHLTVMGLMIGTALEMLVLSLAVADRFAQAQRAREEAQARLVEETEQRRAVEEAYADELAVEVRERTRELEQANADKDRMLTVIGHDLRGPLAGLTQSAELLTAEPPEVTALGKFTADTAGVGRQVLLLIEDLVLWARLRTGLRVPPGRHSVRAVVAPVVALHRATADRRGITFTIAVPEGLLVATDLVLAQTLLRNLVANALKFARNEVVLSADAPVAAAEVVELSVRDDGPGLPAAVLAGLAAESPALPGVEGGLGLRLCVEIGRALDAKLAVQSSGSTGTEFKFVLPAAAPEVSGK